jgi:hypothetical protein
MKKTFLLFWLFTAFSALPQHLTFEEGIPVLAIVSIFPDDEDDEKDLFYARREQAELQKHFPELEVVIVDQRGSLTFYNADEEMVNLTEPKRQFELAVFWDGKKDSPVHTKHGRVKLTEYVSDKTGQNYTSGYLEENKAILDRIAVRRGLFNPDKTSQSVAQDYILQQFFYPMVFGRTNFDPWIHQDLSKVKRIRVYAKRGDADEEQVYEVGFNAQHLVSDLTYLPQPLLGTGKVDFTFSYDAKGLLRKMVNNDGIKGPVKTTVYDYGYDKGILIENSEFEGSEFAIVNGVLITKAHYEWLDYDKNFRIETLEDVIKDGCILTYDNGEKTKSYCPAGAGKELPYVSTRMLYRGDGYASQATSKIEREGDEYIVSNLSQNDQYRKVGTIKLNDKGLIESSHGNAQRGVKSSLRFEYEYF